MMLDEFAEYAEIDALKATYEDKHGTDALLELEDKAADDMLAWVVRLERAESEIAEW